MDEASLSAKTVAELKVLLAEQSLPVSGKKSELVNRLLAGSAVVSLEEKPPITISFDEEELLPSHSVDFMSRMKKPLYGPINMGMAIAIGLALLMISATLVIQPSWLGFGEDYEYDLMDYDPIQTETYAENLVALGHPDWEGRMSGTVEEEATAQYIISEFASMGLSTQLNSFEVPMHKVNSEPSLRVCVQGSVGFGNTPCEGPTAFGS